MNAITVLASLRGLIFVIPFYFAVRARSVLVLAPILLLWLSNGLLIAGFPVASGVVSTVTVSLLAFLMIRYLAIRPSYLQAAVHQQVTQARKEMHVARNDARAWEARAVVAEDRLEVAQERLDALSRD